MFVQQKNLMYGEQRYRCLTSFDDFILFSNSTQLFNLYSPYCHAIVTALLLSCFLFHFFLVLTLLCYTCYLLIFNLTVIDI